MKFRQAFLSLLFLGSLAAGLACESSDDPQDPVDPPPHEGVDAVTFWVYTIDDTAGKAPRLRWKGNGDGPDEDSPEDTPMPWIGYSQPFRVDWEITFEDAPRRGYKVRASQALNGPFLPRDENGNSVFGDITSFSFENAVGAPGLEGEDCDGGPDCPEMLRFDSGPHLIEVLAENVDGVLSDRELGLLEFEVNYPPETLIPVDLPPVCDDETSYPRYVFEPLAGDPIICSFAEGDTIPAGSLVLVRADGYDRLDEADFPDDLCCDLRLDVQNPEVRFQARLGLEGEHDLGQTESFDLVYSSPAAADVFQFEAGPFGYEVVARSLDEHGRRDQTEAAFGFVAGYPPAIVDVFPRNGDVLLLKDPSLGGTWDDNTIAYTATTDVTRYWDRASRRYVSAQSEGTTTINGTWFRFALEFTGATNPREPEPLASERRQYAGGVRSWAYEMIGEFDPGNSISEGVGADRLTLFTNSPELNHWRFDIGEEVEIFVPDLIWDEFALLDPDGDCPSEEFCDIGDELRKHLGGMTLRVVGRSTLVAARFEQGRPETVAGSEPRTEIALGRLGRRTNPVARAFVIQVGLANEGGDLAQAWPN